MNKCPNCGFDVPATSTDNFCPNCGARLPWTIAQTSGAASTPPPGAGATQPGGSATSSYGGQASFPYDPSAPGSDPGAHGQFTAGTSGARRSTAYASPDATQQGLPSYLGNVNVGNLPASRTQQQQSLPPVAPAGSADPTTNMLLGILRSASPTSSRGLVRLAIAIVVIVVAFIIVAKVVSVLLSWLPWIVLAAIIIYLWQRQRMRRGGRLP